MTYIIEIEEGRETDFTNYISNLEYIKDIKKTDTEISDYQEPSKDKILKSIERGYKEAILHSEGKLKLKSARELLDKI